MEGGVESAAFSSPLPHPCPQKTKTKQKKSQCRVPLIMSHINLKLAASEAHPSVITLSRLPLVLKQNINRQIKLVLNRVISVH